MTKRVMRTVYRGLLAFVTRTALLAALLLPLSYSARPHASSVPHRAPGVRLEFDAAWAAEVDRMIDRGDREGLWLKEVPALPVLIDRLLQEERGDRAARALERIFEIRGVTDESGEPLRIRSRDAGQHDVLALWYRENRRKIEERW